MNKFFDTLDQRSRSMRQAPYRGNTLDRSMTMDGRSMTILGPQDGKEELVEEPKPMTPTPPPPPPPPPPVIVAPPVPKVPKTRRYTSEERRRMITAAFQARENAYSPYSKFRVGAALLAEDGQIITGSNVENASYGGTICAERTAFVKAVSEGIRGFIGLAVTTDVPSPISPCGICRQFIREFCLLDMPILMIPSTYAGEGGPGGALEITVEAEIKQVTLGELLPLSFGPEHLELPRQCWAGLE